MGCFTPKTTYSLPKYIKGPTKEISSKVSGLLDKTYTPYTGDMTAGLNATQTDAMAGIKSMSDNGMTPPRVIDNVPGANGGPAGSTQDYMDPYLSEVLAPVLRNINTSRMQSNMDLDAAANMSGAFGDKGTGVARSETNERAIQATGDATAQAYSNAFNTAMGLKSDDINRMTGAKTQEADLLTKLFGMGTAEQETAQSGMDAKFAEFLRGQGFDIDQITKLAGVVGSLQSGTMQQSPSTASSVLGSAAGIGSFLAAL